MSYNLTQLRDALDALQQNKITVAAFCAIWRNQAELLATLPQRYTLVMEDLLQRLETGSLFTEESCSFSQEDLHANLALWLDKARQTLPA